MIASKKTLVRFANTRPLPASRHTLGQRRDLDALIDDLPPVNSVWPDPAPGQFLVFVGCSSDYFDRHGACFARSLDRNSPGTHFHLHIVNPDETSERALSDLKRSLEATTLTWTRETFDFTGASQEHVRSYFAGIRFVRLVELLRARRTDVLMLDIDVIIRDRLDDIRSLARSYDCAIHTRFHKRKNREKFFASAVYAAPHAASLAYLEDVAAQIASTIIQRKAKWYGDQIALLHAYRSASASQPPLRLLHLPEKYADRNFRKSSAIWAGKGRLEKLDQSFFAERAAYLPKEQRLGEAKTSTSILNPKVAIILPRLDLPFKNPGGVRGLPDRLRRRRFQDMRLRVHWRLFAESVKSAFDRKGNETRIVSHPLWKVTTEFVENLDADIVFIPHRQRFQFSHLRHDAYFYMQSAIPWLFTVDPLGWGAGSSVYPCDDHLGDPTRGTFEQYVDRLVRRNSSKYRQPRRVPRQRLVDIGEIPAEPFIFFACQRPTDDAVRFFSPHEALDIAASVCSWAKSRGVSIVLKGHPTKSADAKLYRRAISEGDVYWSTASIHDLISYSSAVYVINSGVGLESILHNQPVVTFGQADYDAVAIKGNLNALDQTWAQVLADDPNHRLERYRQFIDWYVRMYCVDLTNPKSRDARIQNLIAQAV